ncbi:alkylphosphonate utilization protein [Legionella quinlivanii]|uniref:Alkylphosphonate utilization protein n=1 Tax=Legionella quinlivanii TaxID=45073 RepID=A0A364LF51_9GAMM|nr:zinc ribbon domain-containing protein YjdM [Legionella quinlivanii]RAP34547.1 alkylphosphonate utilization protein [Legionella quinlivanii]
MTQLCPECNSEYTYASGTLFVCSQCSYEWPQETEQQQEDHTKVVKDAHGTVLNDGDTISVIKDLKIKGSSQVVKVGTKVRNIRLAPDEDHNIDCKIEGIGPMKLKSEFVKKA